MEKMQGTQVKMVADATARACGGCDGLGQRGIAGVMERIKGKWDRTYIMEARRGRAWS